MKLTLKDKKLILYFLGILLLAISYLFVYKPQMEEVSTLEASNASLQDKLNDLLELAKNKDFYVAETESMRQRILAYCQQFPSMIYDEDGIVLAKNMESSLDMVIRNVGTGSAELLYYLDSGEEQEQSQDEETMMEQANAQTREQINEIEGVEEEEERETVADLSSAALHRVQDSIQFLCTYQGLKDSVRYLADQKGRMTMNNVTASFDPQTGNLAGSMTVNLYFMTGVDNIYNSPDAGSVSYGTDNIFGTLEALTGGDLADGEEPSQEAGEPSQEEALAAEEPSGEASDQEGTSGEDAALETLEESGEGVPAP